MMKDRLSLVSYSLATIAGICFVSGLYILSGEGSIQTWTDLKQY